MLIIIRLLRKNNHKNFLQDAQYEQARILTAEPKFSLKLRR